MTKLKALILSTALAAVSAGAFADGSREGRGGQEFNLGAHSLSVHI